MTRNPVGDAEAFSAVYWSAMYNAHNLELIKSGCTPSAGTGSFDVDIASGTAIVGQSNGEVSVSAQMETLTSPSNDADLDSGETRVDLITVDSTGTTNTTEGTPHAGTDSDPVVAPDIPSGEVLIAAVTVDGGASSVGSGDINDYRVLFGPTAYPFDNADLNSGAGSGLNADLLDNTQASAFVLESETVNENGTFSVSSSTFTTVTVSFTNTYLTAMIWAQEQNEETSAAWGSWNTNANGNITGADIDVENADSSSHTYVYLVMGVTA